LTAWAGLAALCALAALSPAGAGAEHKLSPDLRDRIRGGQPGDSLGVIIQYAVEPSATDEAAVRERGGVAGKRFSMLRALAATVPASEVEELASDPRVIHVSPDRVVRPSMNLAATAAGVGPYRAFPDLTGAGVVVAVIDSGIAPHEDLPALAGFIDFLQPNAPDSSDPFGHGTHVGGIIGGRRHPAPDGSGLAYGGIAPGADILSLRVLDRWGRGRVSDVIDAIQWAVENKDAYGIRILNLSLGHQVAEPAEVDPLARACEAAWSAGLVVVASAGNLGMYGNGTITSPGNSPRILTVGASDDRATLDVRDDGFAGFSSQGPTLFDLVVKPDLLAPGHLITSLRSAHSSLDVAHPEARVALDSGPRGVAREPRYFEMSGSSMAAALVSGVVALMIENDPALTPDTVKARLMSTARRLDTATLFERGAGIVDADAALASRDTASTSVSSAVYLDDVDVKLIDVSVVWGGTGSWDLETIYGDPLFWREDDIWASGFLDDPCVTGEGLVWQGLTSEGLVWQGKTGDTTTTGEGLVWQGLSAEGLVWQGLTAEGLVWQGLTGEGLVWQGKSGGGVTGDGLVWQGLTGELACTSTAGQLWQAATVTQGGLVWQGGDVSSEGLVWQGRK